MPLASGVFNRLEVCFLIRPVWVTWGQAKNRFLLADLKWFPIEKLGGEFIRCDLHQCITVNFDSLK